MFGAIPCDVTSLLKCFSCCGYFFMLILNLSIHVFVYYSNLPRTASEDYTFSPYIILFRTPIPPPSFLAYNNFLLIWLIFLCICFFL